MASPTEENYLKALFILKDSQGLINSSDLSSTLNVSMPSVNSMVKNLKAKGLIHHEKYKPVSLTSLGSKTAALIIRKHRLTEMYLVEKMGFGWEEVHNIAEQMEHIQSPKLFERMDELLNHPAIDPHGSPIPNKNGILPSQNYLPLNEQKPEIDLKLSALAKSSAELLDFLNSRELKLGTLLKVKSVESYDGSMVVSYRNHPSEFLSEMVCKCLLVERV